jgi:hypothetical protein
MGGLGRWLGYALLALALAAAVLDGVDAASGGDWRPARFVEWWSSLAPRSVDAVMLAWPWLTDHVLAPIVALPAWAVLGTPGAILAIACRSSNEDKRRRRRRARSF